MVVHTACAVALAAIRMRSMVLGAAEFAHAWLADHTPPTLVPGSWSDQHSSCFRPHQEFGSILLVFNNLLESSFPLLAAVDTRKRLLDPYFHFGLSPKHVPLGNKRPRWLRSSFCREKWESRANNLRTGAKRTLGSDIGVLSLDPTYQKGGTKYRIGELW